MIDKDKLQSVLLENNIGIEGVFRYKQCGWRVKLTSGSAVFVYDKGGMYCQGNDSDNIRRVLEKELELEEANNRVFLVYGHDTLAKEQLARMLERWGIEPIVLDEMPVEGGTLIEQLEHYIPQTNYGIALLTPDDCIHLLGSEAKTLYRARQNVVFELGLLFMKLGRKRVAIITKAGVDCFDLPSDLSGIHRFEYKNSVVELRETLARELRRFGYGIDM